MAQTDKETWLEGAEEYGAPLEDWKKVPVVTEAEIDETMSVPGVKYSTDPSVSTRATPQGFVQLHLGSLFSKINGLEGNVEEAIQDAETAAGNANTAAARTESAVTAADAAATRANTAATGAEKVDASLVGMTITITDRNGTSVSTNIGFDIYRTYSSVAQMNADAPNVPEGKFVMIATTDPTDPENARLYGKNSQGSFTFLSDLDQASSAAWADWLDNMKPQIEADHTRAATDHTTATQDHTSSVDATSAANTAANLANEKAQYAAEQGDYSKNMADHPAYIGEDNYWYIWNYAQQKYVKSSYAKGDDLDWESMTEEEKQALADEVLSRIAFDSKPTPGSSNTVTSGGIYTALGNREKIIEASVATSQSIVDELT